MDRRRGSSILAESMWRLEARLGHIALSARHHQLPRRLEDDYEPDESAVLGSGLHGSVVSAQRRGCSSGQSFAVKSFALKSIAFHKRAQFAAEAELFLCMDHPHVARLYDVYESDVSLHFVMERLEGGELYDRVKALKVFPERDVVEVAWQMLLALNYIHSHRIVHGDVKLENVMYDRKGSNHLKLIDFGFSKRWDPSKPGVAGRLCGTKSYIAPEALQDRPCNSQCDLWSLGVVVFSLLVGYMPFSTPEQIVSGDYKVKPEKWKSVSDDASDFTKSLLQVDSQWRLTAQSALRHPWIARGHAQGIHVVDPMTVDALLNFSHSPRFRRCCMQVVAWSLSEKECAGVEDIFLEMDARHEGRITLGELRQELPQQVEDAEVRQIFDALVSDHDQEIHYSDFLAAMVDSRIKLNDGLLHSAFERFDVDHAGCITMSDISQVVGDYFDGQRVLSLIKEADILKNGGMSYKEFEAYLKGTSCVNLSEKETAAPQQCCSVQ